MADADLLDRIVRDPAIFDGKPIVRGRRLAVEHVLGMLAAGDDIPTILAGYPWLERDDVLACIEYEKRRAELDHRIVREERLDKLSRLSRDRSK